VAFLCGMIVVGILRERKLVVVVVLLVVGWQTVLPSSVQQRILMTSDSAGELDSSAAERVQLWDDAIHVFKTSPVIGLGFNTYEFLGRVGPYRDTHNYYVKVLVETGLLGLFLYFALLFKMSRASYMLFRSSPDPFWTSVGLGVLAATVSLASASFFGDRWTYQQVSGQLWILMGCVFAGHRILAEEAGTDVRTKSEGELQPEPKTEELPESVVEIAHLQIR
jgi:putative inorganic carbon (hco3(-)) transporter